MASAQDASDFARQVADIYAAKDRYTYYLLAIAAAAIGFAANQTSGQALRFDHFLLGFAVLFWGFSFYFGCQNRLHHISYLDNSFWRSALTTVAEHELAEKGGTVPPEAVTLIAEAIDGIGAQAESDSVSGSDFFLYQYRTLLLGTGLYVCWHIWDMALHRAPN